MINSIIVVTLIFLLICASLSVYWIIRGPRFVDRIVCTNAFNTLVIAIICLLSVYLKADYLLDVALIYALLGIVTNTLLVRNVISKQKREAGKK